MLKDNYQIKQTLLDLSSTICWCHREIICVSSKA